MTSVALRVAGDLLDRAFPARCAGCRLEGEPICAACLPRLLVRIGEPPGVPIGLPGDLPPPLLQLEWVAPFGGLARRALHALKYDDERRLAEPLGRAVAARWRRVGRGGDVVVPVPIHAERERERGYDQAVLIGAVVARELALPVVRALVRTRATRAQFSLGRTARARNLAGAFAVLPPRAATVRGRRVLLVDDVVTTGATLSAAAEALLAAGATGVVAAAVARER